MMLRLCIGVLCYLKWGTGTLAVLAVAIFLLVTVRPNEWAVVSYGYEIQRLTGIDLPPVLVKLVMSLAASIPMIALTVVAHGFQRIESWLKQRETEQEMRGFAAGHSEGRDVPFVLYLRPFETTATIVSNRFEPSFFPLTPAQVLRDPEFELESAVHHSIPEPWKFVALGRPGEHVGAARVQSDEHSWKQQLLMLANAARLIVCVPASNPGVRWEVKSLRESLNLSKTVFVMPPLSERYNVERAWREAFTILREDGLTLPPYSPAGCAFRLESTGEVSKTWQINFRESKPFRAALEDLYFTMLPAERA